MTRKLPNRCEIGYNTIQSMCSNLTSEFQNAYQILHNVCTRVMVWHLIGLDLAKYNKAPPHVYATDQAILNESISYINKNINKMNMNHHVTGPWLDETMRLHPKNSYTSKRDCMMAFILMKILQIKTVGQKDSRSHIGTLQNYLLEQLG